LDEREITRQLNNYCRAMDRCDIDLGCAVFHPDAEADYGEIFQGTGHGFVAFAIGTHAYLETHLHRISNISIAVEGDVAGSETYVDVCSYRRRDGAPVEYNVRGRYIDRWERRDGHWAISRRRYVHAMDASRPVNGALYANAGRRDRSDPSYGTLQLTE
jgi:ketosteroid isomerase-like protein